MRPRTFLQGNACSSRRDFIYVGIIKITVITFVVELDHNLVHDFGQVQVDVIQVEARVCLHGIRAELARCSVEVDILISRVWLMHCKSKQFEIIQYNLFVTDFWSI